MPTTLDLREGRMDVLFRPGNSDAVQLVFPTGALTGITLAALLNGVTLPISQVADTVTLTPTSVQSALIATGIGVPWTLSIVGGNVLLSGRWIPHFDGTATNDRSTVVVLNGASVAVTVLAIGSGGGGGAVTSVNGQVGVVVLSAANVGADASGAAAAAQAASQPLDSDLTAIAALATTAYGRSLLTAANAAGAQSTLGLGTMSTQNASGVAITGGTVTGITDITIADGGTGASTAANARTNLGLGTISVQDAAAVNITGGTITGITDLAVADGGTGASTAANARTNLGLVIGTDVPPVANAALTGNPTAPTQTAGDSSTRLATTAFVAAAAAAANLMPTPLKTAAYAAVNFDLVPVDTTGGTFAVTLPTAPAQGTTIAVKWVAGATAPSVALGGSDVFNLAGGTTSATLSATNQTLYFYYRNAQAIWYITTSFSKGGLDTFYQPLDAELTAIAGLTSAADTVPYYTGSGSASLATFTAAGRSLVAGANAAAQRTTLGLGTSATVDTGTTSGTIPLLGASGVLAIGRLATGTPDGTKFVRDDGTLVTPSGSGGGMATDPLWNAAGDIPYATADNTGAILAYVADGKVLGAVSGLPAWVDPRGSVIVASHVDTTVVNSTTETTVASLSLPGGAVVADDELTIELYADSLNNSGGSINYTFRWKFGSTTVMSSNSFSIATNANREKWDPTMSILMESTTAQRCKARFLGSSANTNSLAGFLAGNSFTGYGTAAEDTSTAKNVILTVQMNTANAAADFVCHGAVLKLNKKR